MGRNFGGMCASLAGAEVLGMIHLHEEDFQVLLGYILIRREEVKPVIWPSGYVTTSKVQEVSECPRATFPGLCRPRKGSEPSLLLLISR